MAAGLGVSIPAAGLLVTAYALGMIVGGPVVTVLTARLARKPLIAALVTVSVVGNLGSALAPNYAILLPARFLAGSVVATFFAVAIATAVGMAPAGRQASTVAKVAVGMNLGIVLGTPIGTFIGQHGSPTSAGSPPAVSPCCWSTAPARSPGTSSAAGWRTGR
nr:MFS transporter [Actinoallomurus sp. NBC_01490]